MQLSRFDRLWLANHLRRLLQVLRTKAHGQQVSQGDLLDNLLVLDGGEDIVVRAHLAGRERRRDHVDGRRVGAEFPDELTADTTWGGGRGGNVAGFVGNANVKEFTGLD